jgi:hypothetical protein
MSERRALECSVVENAFATSLELLGTVRETGEASLPPSPTVVLPLVLFALVVYGIVPMATAFQAALESLDGLKGILEFFLLVVGGEIGKFSTYTGERTRRGWSWKTVRRGHERGCNRGGSASMTR